MDAKVLARLHAARAAEKAQTLFYRRLAAAAEDAGDAALAERLNELLADEQHHLSRLTARLLELGEAAGSLSDVKAPVTPLDDWERVARDRERLEVRLYEELLDAPLDAATAVLVRETLRVEREHARNLSGKWTEA